ncbi:MAG: IS21 family transposase, partial [Dehalococcoidia bacterium]
LAKYPRVAASRLFDMVCERGYPGQPSQFRAVIATLRPRRTPEAYLRLRTLAGEVAQVDWAHFGRLQIGRASRPLMAFLMVLSFSRAIFLRFYLSQRLGNFLHGHEAAFKWFGGCVRCCQYDNLKSVVLERIGNAIRFHPQFLEFAAHCRFEPRPVAVARGNEKGRVERAVRFVRTRFFAARRFRNLDDLNHQAIEWCETIALNRPWPDDTRRTVADVFAEEKEKLLALPETTFPCDDRLEVSVGKTPYVRFDLNDYSVPHESVAKTLVVTASQDTVRVLDGERVLASHQRSYDRDQQIEDRRHIEDLVKAKRAAAQHRTTDLLSRSAPSTVRLLERMAEQRLPLGRATKELLDLLRTYGPQELEAAISEALANQAAHTQAVRHILDRNRRTSGRPPCLPLPLPDDPRVRDFFVKPHDLQTYDLEHESDTPPKEDPGDDESENNDPLES